MREPFLWGKVWVWRRWVKSKSSALFRNRWIGGSKAPLRPLTTRHAGCSKGITRPADPANGFVAVLSGRVLVAHETERGRSDGDGQHPFRGQPAQDLCGGFARPGSV